MNVFLKHTQELLSVRRYVHNKILCQLVYDTS